MWTSLTSKGMYCSASHWMDSSNSSWLIRGMAIFLMMTEWPLTPMATSFCLMRISPRSSCTAWTMAVEFMSVLSTMDSGGNGFIPKFCRE